MSIRAIPNQPINFLGTDLIAACPDRDVPLYVASGDSLIFQFGTGRCEGQEPVTLPLGNDWIINSEGWVFDGLGGACGLVNNGLNYIELDTFFPTAGTYYEVEINVTSVSGDGVFVSFGGFQRVVNSPGVHRFVGEAIGTLPPRITLVSDNSAICIASFAMYLAGQNWSVVAMDGDDEVATFTVGTTPEYFTITPDTVVAIIPVSEVDAECFSLQLRDECEGSEVVLCSQAIQVDPCANLTLVRVCLDEPGLGFAPGRFEARLDLALVRPTWSYEVAEQRLSNGRILRTYIDRQERWQLSITTQSQWLHPWIAAWVLFDHLYIGNKEWSVDVEDYSPEYGDAQVGTANVVLTVRPKEELVRRVRCAEEGEGCNPVNDPICNTANAVVSVVNFEGELFVRVDILSFVGFEVQEIQWTIDGVPQTPIAVMGPGPQALGPVLAGQEVALVFVNRQDPSCNDVRPAFVVESGDCAVPGAVRLVIGESCLGGSAAPFAVNGTTTGFYSYSYNGGAAVTIAATDTVPYLGPGTYCVWPSDEAGEYSGLFTDDVTNVAVQTIDIDFEALIAASDGANYVWQGCALPSQTIILPPLPGMVATGVVDDFSDLAGHTIQFLPGIYDDLTDIQIALGSNTTGPVMVVWPASLPAAGTIALYGDFFPSSMDALALALNPALSGFIDDNGGVSTTTPTSASQAARQLLYDSAWTLPASWLTDLIL